MDTRGYVQALAEADARLAALSEYAKRAEDSGKEAARDAKLWAGRAFLMARDKQQADARIAALLDVLGQIEQAAIQRLTDPDVALGQIGDLATAALKDR
jgi:hypothetical protein